eukprot:2119500-Rhodomonas_salina.1
MDTTRRAVSTKHLERNEDLECHCLSLHSIWPQHPPCQCNVASQVVRRRRGRLCRRCIFTSLPICIHLLRHRMDEDIRPACAGVELACPPRQVAAREILACGIRSQIPFASGTLALELSACAIANLCQCRSTQTARNCNCAPDSGSSKHALQLPEPSPGLAPARSVDDWR